MDKITIKDYDKCSDSILKKMSDMATNDIESMMNILATVQWYHNKSDEWLVEFIFESLEKWFDYYNKRRWDYWEMVVKNERKC